MKQAIIYSIQHVDTGKQYIGSTVNKKSRWSGHRTALNGNYHGNSYLQRAWNKYGEESFEFKVLEICEEKDRYVKEKQWVLQEKSYKTDWGYNLVIPEDTGGYVQTDALRQIQSRVNSVSARRQWAKTHHIGKTRIIVKHLETGKETYYRAAKDLPFHKKHEQNFNFKHKVFYTRTYNKAQREIDYEYNQVKIRYQKYLEQKEPTKIKKPKKATRGLTYKYIFKGPATLKFKNSIEAAEYFNVSLGSVSNWARQGYWKQVTYVLKDVSGTIHKTASSPQEFISYKDISQAGIRKLQGNRIQMHKGFCYCSKETHWKVERV